MTDDLPEGWVGVRADDACLAVQSGGTPKGKPFTPRGDIPFLKVYNIVNQQVSFDYKPQFIPSAVHAGELRRSIVRPDDVLMNIVGPPLGKVALVPDTHPEWNINQALVLFRPKPCLLPKLLYYFLREGGEIARIEGQYRGSAGQTNISLSQSRQFEIPIAPLPEQHRIVEAVEALLERVNRAKERLDRVPLILKRFRQAVLAAACSGKLTEEWRNHNLAIERAQTLVARLLMRPERKRRYPNGAELREDLDLPELPTDWTWTNLRLLSEPTEALCYGVVQPGPEVDDGVPLVRAGDLHDLPGSLAGLRKVTRDIDASYARSRLRGGEVLVTVVGANVGVAAIAPPSTRGFNIARAVAKLPIREVEGRYVLLWLQSSLAYRWMFGDTREVARPTLNIEQLESLPVPLPPLEEQAEIVRQVESLFALAGNIERRVQAATARASHLPQAILSNAFSGELVPTEADLARAEGRMYETAEELLARVRGERENGVGEVSSARHGVRGSGDVRSSRSAR